MRVPAGGFSVTAAILRLEHKKETIRTKSNIRILNAFKESALKERSITTKPAPRCALRFQSVEVRFEPDLCGYEGSAPRYLVLDPRREPADKEIALMTLELGWHVLRQNGVNCQLSDFEYVSVLSGQVHKIRRLRPRTLQRADGTAELVAALWELL